MVGDRGSFYLFIYIFFLKILFWSFRLYLSASLCTYFWLMMYLFLMSSFFMSCI